MAVSAFKHSMQAGDTHGISVEYCDRKNGIGDSQGRKSAPSYSLNPCKYMRSDPWQGVKNGGSVVFARQYAAMDVDAMLAAAMRDRVGMWNPAAPLLKSKASSSKDLAKHLFSYNNVAQIPTTLVGKSTH